MNDKRIFTEAVRHMAQRQSVRAFNEEPIPDETLHLILQAGINTASGGNLQPYSIIVEQDRERAKQLGSLLGYPFISTAPLNLIFLLDWHKLAVYSKCRQAPFVENCSMNHLFIAWDDVVICAQAIETAAWMEGIGSCYIGHAMDCSDQLTELYNLPDMVFPVLVLTMGYPKKLSARREKLPLDMTVFHGKYPLLTEEEVCTAFDRKYKGKITPIPPAGTARDVFLDKFQRALRTSYDAETVRQIIEGSVDQGYINEIQRLFGIHYHPDREIGNNLLDALYSKKLYPFIDTLDERPEP